MIRKARVTDVKVIQALTKPFAEKGKMLPVSYGDITERLRDFFLYLDDSGEPIGCIALHVSWEDLVEIRTLAVKEEAQGHGIGTKLIQAALDEARELQAKKVFTLTFVPDFFSRSGFVEVEHSTLPHKIWQDCMKCVLFPDCGETAMSMEL